MENITTGITYITIVFQDIYPIQNQKIQKRKFEQTNDVTIQLRKTRTYKKICRDNVLMTTQ